MGSGSEDEEDDEPTHHIRGGGLGLGALVGLGGNGPDSLGPLGPSDMSVQSTNSDSKMTQDDSDQVSEMTKINVTKMHSISNPQFFSFNQSRKRAQSMVIQTVVVIHKRKIKVPMMVRTVQNGAVHEQQSKPNN